MRSQHPQETQGPSPAMNNSVHGEPALPLRKAFAGLRPARAVQPHMFHAVPAQRPPSGPQPDENDFRNSRFSAAAPSGVRRHMFPAGFSRTAAAHSLRRRSAGNNRLFGAAYGDNRLRVTTGKNPPLQLPKTPFPRSARQPPPGTASPAQRPLNARMSDRLSTRPAILPPVHRLETPKAAREQPGARTVSAKSRNGPAPLPDLILLVK